MSANNLPNSDPDLKLARRIGELLEKRAPLSSLEDPVIAALEDYKQNRQTLLRNTKIPSSDLWDKIDRQTRPSEKTETRVHTISFFRYRAVWAAAAAILIAALVGFYYFSFMGQPSLIAETQQQIQTITLPDGSRVMLRPHSQLYRLQSSKEEMNYRLEGEGFFTVTDDPERIFSVEAGHGRVRVLGTQFNLSHWGEMTQLFLEEGLVQFENRKARESIVLHPGQSARITSDQKLERSESATSEEYTDWMTQELVFRNRPAYYIVDELEQHFAISIIIPEETKNIAIGGRLTLENLEKSLSDLGLVLDGTFRKTGPNRYTFIPDNS